MTDARTNPVLHGRLRYWRSWFTFSLLNEAHLIAGKVTNLTLDGCLLLRNNLRLLDADDLASDGILHKTLIRAGDDVELHPVGPAIWTKIRFVLHHDHLLNTSPLVYPLSWKIIPVF